MAGKTSPKSAPQTAIQRAVARAERILPGTPAPKGKRDPRWQAIIRVGEFIKSQPELVWEFAHRWGKHPQADLRAAVTTCLLEHLLEHHFELLFPRVRSAALESPRFAETFRSCWGLGQAQAPKNAARFKRLQRELRRSRSLKRPGVNAMAKKTSTKSAKVTPPKVAAKAPDPTVSHLIDVRIKALSDWRGETLARLRAIIRQSDSDIVEEWKWSVPVWSNSPDKGGGIICTGETYKSAVKLTFAKGAALEDPSGLFNSSLEGSTRRAIDFHEGDKINEKALKALIRAAAALNAATRATPRPPTGAGSPKKPKGA